MTERVMLDIETLGTDPGCVILQVGAVRFGRDGIGAEFDESPDIVSCELNGLTIDAETLRWWMAQDHNDEMLLDGRGLELVLSDFADWYGDADELWCKGPDFDAAILNAAYDAVGVEPPWDYWQTRDVRTIEALPVDVEVEHGGVEHDALDDARHQARLVSETLTELAGDTDD